MKLAELKDRLRNKYSVRIVAGVLSIALLGGSVGLVSVSAAKNEDNATVTEETTEDKDDKVNKLLDSVSVSDEDAGKKETVYFISDASGNVEKTIVSDHLVNKDGAATLKDKSNLSDIKNVKGKETFTQDGDNLTWQADGKDIYYQGTSTEKAPVTQKVTYSLDGKEIKPEDLAGKSGKVTIRFDYTNTTTYTETVNGEEVTVCVPFAAVTALMLDDSFSNVEVTNGKVEGSGDNNIVVGYALPGVSDALDIEDGDLDFEIPDYVEVTADVENFELAGAMTVVANAGDFVTSDGASADSLDDMINELVDASKQLEDGAGKLSDGLKDLESGLSAYLDGTLKLAGGIEKLKDGSGTLEGGVKTINSSAKTISDGLSTLDSTLNNAAYFKKSVDDQFDDEAVSATVSTAITSAYTSTTVKTGVSAKVTAGLKANDQVYITLKAGVVQQATEAILAQAKAQVDMLVGQGYTQEQAVAAIFASSHDGVTLDEYATATANTICESLGTGITTQVLDGASTAIAEDGQLADGITASIKSTSESVAVNTAKGIASSIEAKQASGYSLVTGAKALSEGTNSLVTKLPVLTSGIKQLYDGSQELVGNNKEIASGVKQLVDGSGELSDGMIQFNEEGINKIVNAYDGDLKPLANRLQALLDAGSEYQTYTELADGTKGSVKFIYKLGAVEAQANAEEK